MMVRLLSPWLALRQRTERWFLSRRPPSDQITLTQRSVYIVPSRAGWMLGLTLFTLLLTSINYQLNLGYLLTFLLAGSITVGMHMGHGTLRGLSMHLLGPEAQFAGTSATLRVVLENGRARPRYAIGLAVRGSGHWAWVDVPGYGREQVEVAFDPAQRGWQAVPALTAETRFPLGTFRVWTVWRPAAQILVYPAPEAHPPPLPPGTAAEPDGISQTRSQGAGEFDGVRAYRRGDPLKLVVWKKAARAQAAGSEELVSRDTENAQRHTLWLDLQATGLSELEPRLSRLCAWVLNAERLDLDYGLRLNGRSITPSHGEVHKRACLELLATV